MPTSIREHEMQMFLCKLFFFLLSLFFSSHFEYGAEKGSVHLLILALSCQRNKKVTFSYNLWIRRAEIFNIDYKEEEGYL